MRSLVVLAYSIVVTMAAPVLVVQLLFSRRGQPLGCPTPCFRFALLTLLGLIAVTSLHILRDYLKALAFGGSILTSTLRSLRSSPWGSWLCCGSGCSTAENEDSPSSLPSPVGLHARLRLSLTLLTLVLRTARAVAWSYPAD